MNNEKETISKEEAAAILKSVDSTKRDAIKSFRIPLLLIAGIWAAMGLPIVNIGAIYLINKLDVELQPKPITKIFLWVSLILQLTMALLIIYDMTIGF